MGARATGVREFILLRTLRSLEQADLFGANLFEKIIVRCLHLRQFSAGIGKDVNSYAAEIRLIADRSIQKRTIRIVEH